MVNLPIKTAVRHTKKHENYMQSNRPEIAMTSMSQNKKTPINKIGIYISSQPIERLKKFTLWSFLITSAISTAIGIYLKPLILNENQLLYLTSTSSQVLAAIYALTLAGLIFFINELDREKSKDDTLEYITSNIKSRHYSLLIFITALSGTSILSGNMAIAAANISDITIKAALTNIAQSAFIFSLVSIIFFIFEIIDPNAIKKASQRVKDSVRIDGDPSDNETKEKINSAAVDFSSKKPEHITNREDVRPESIVQNANNEDYLIAFLKMVDKIERIVKAYRMAYGQKVEIPTSKKILFLNYQKSLPHLKKMITFIASSLERIMQKL